MVILTCFSGNAFSFYPLLSHKSTTLLYLHLCYLQNDSQCNTDDKITAKNVFHIEDLHKGQRNFPQRHRWRKKKKISLEVSSSEIMRQNHANTMPTTIERSWYLLNGLSEPWKSTQTTLWRRVEEAILDSNVTPIYHISKVSYRHAVMTTGWLDNEFSSLTSYPVKAGEIQS